MTASGRAPSPPSVGALRGQGVRGALVSCADLSCGHSSVLPFEALRAADGEPFPALRHRPYQCSRCGGRAASIMPDWPPRDFKAHPPTWAI